MRLKIFILFVVTILSTSCLSPTPISKKYKDGNAGNIAVISLLGNQTSFRYLGTTIFEARYKTVGVPNWGIDRYVLASVKKRLVEEDHRVIDVEYDADELMGAYKDKAINIEPDHEFNRQYFIDTAKKNNIDKFIVIYRGGQYEIVPKLPETSAFGHGFFYQTHMFRGIIFYALASVETHVVDGKNGDLIEKNIGYAYRSIDKKYWDSSYQQGKTKVINIRKSDEKELEQALKVSTSRAALWSVQRLGFL